MIYVSQLLRHRSGNMSHLIKQMATSYITLYSQEKEVLFYIFFLSIVQIYIYIYCLLVWVFLFGFFCPMGLFFHFH